MSDLTFKPIDRCVLEAVRALEPHAAGAAIQAWLNTNYPRPSWQFGGWLSGAIYVSLHRLEQASVLTSGWSEEGDTERGHRRRHYARRTHVGTGLYQRAISLVVPGHDGVLEQSWKAHKWMVNVSTGPIPGEMHEHMERWCREFVRRSGWKIGNVTIAGKTWVGFSAKADMDRFVAQWGGDSEDANSVETIHARFSEALGGALYTWPPIAEVKPWPWQFRRTIDEQRINMALAVIGRGPISKTMREVFWREVRKGQDVREGAGGYLWRCWCAALGLPYVQGSRTYQDIASDLAANVGPDSGAPA